MKELNKIEWESLAGDKTKVLKGKLRSLYFCNACVAILKLAEEGKRDITSRQLKNILKTISYRHAVSILRDLVDLGFLYIEEVSSKNFLFGFVYKDKKMLLNDFKDLILEAFEWHKTRII